jgi:hypothetical protein
MAPHVSSTKVDADPELMEWYRKFLAMEWKNEDLKGFADFGQEQEAMRRTKGQAEGHTLTSEEKKAQAHLISRKESFYRAKLRNSGWKMEEIQAVAARCNGHNATKGPEAASHGAEEANLKVNMVPEILNQNRVQNSGSTWKAEETRSITESSNNLQSAQTLNATRKQLKNMGALSCVGKENVDLGSEFRRRASQHGLKVEDSEEKKRPELQALRAVDSDRGVRLLSGPLRQAEGGISGFPICNAESEYETGFWPTKSQTGFKDETQSTQSQKDNQPFVGPRRLIETHNAVSPTGTTKANFGVEFRRRASRFGLKVSFEDQEGIPSTTISDFERSFSVVASLSKKNRRTIEWECDMHK